MSLDGLLDKVYDDANYNCAHFVVDAVKLETGQDLGSVLCGVLRPSTDRQVDHAWRTIFKRAAQPVSPCLVVMQGCGAAGTHLGLYLRGGVAHLTRKGPEYVPIDVATLGFQKVRYYTWRL
jgi:hypothetical protein